MELQTKISVMKFGEDYYMTVKVDEGAVPELHELQNTVCDVTVTKPKAKRSLDANAYCWVLINKLSEKVNNTPTELYKHYVREVGGNCEYVCIAEKAVDSMKKFWEGCGVGWQVETFESKVIGCVNMRLIYGSSKYDTKQMSRLIDLIVTDCKEQGIQTATPDQISNLISQWEASNV